MTNRPPASKRRPQAGLRVTSLNLNGVRSAARKGVFEWLAKHDCDVLCVQELKAQEADLSPEHTASASHRGSFHFAQKKGYSGTGIYCRMQPSSISSGFGSIEFDAEGRYTRIDLDNADQALSIISLYLPSGSSSPERQDAKWRFLREFTPHLISLVEENRRTGREFLICGDINIAHREIDLKNWRSNQKNSGFLPEERAWLDMLFGEIGFIDIFRTLDQRPEQYTWWSSRGRAWDNNVGWRIDYHLGTPGIAAKARKASIYLKERFSDHAPLTIDYDWPV